MPRSSYPVILILVPIGSWSGELIPPRNPDILRSHWSSFRTTQAYGTYFSKPAGGTVIIVYVSTWPVPSKSLFSNPLFPQFWQKYTVAKCKYPHFVHFFASTLPALSASMNSCLADKVLHTFEYVDCAACAGGTKIMCKSDLGVFYSASSCFSS